MCQNAVFCIFCIAGTTERWFCTARHQVLGFWAPPIFLVCVVFVKLHFSIC